MRGVVAADAVDAVHGELLGAAFDRDGGSGGRGEDVGHGREMYTRAAEEGSF